MPELLLQETSPYGTRRASLLRGDGDTYLYLEDLLGAEPETTSAVWVANHVPAPTDASATSAPGSPPRMGAGGTRHPEGCPELGRNVQLVWFEEGDAVALVDGEGVLAVIPGWAGRDDFYGYSRYARGRSPLAWELTNDARQVLDQKVVESREFWAWRNGGAWPEIRKAGQVHLEDRIGPQDAAWPVGESTFPELIATRHRMAAGNIWVTATTGLSAQRMAGVEQYLDVPDGATRIELAIARAEPDQAGAELLGALATIPFGRCTWLGEGHTIGGVPGAYPQFGPDKAALLLTANPPSAPGKPPPLLTGLVRRGDPVTYLWVILIDEETFRLARGRDARAAVGHLRQQGTTWVQ
ncbi:MAG TPA: suppressor of fused domain protein [Aquihabitans sp.]|nr:suppressor of fused domain protein [Aquihabitans sp.]